MSYAMNGKQLAAAKAKDPANAINETPSGGFGKKTVKKIPKKTAKKGPAQNQELTQ